MTSAIRFAPLYKQRVWGGRTLESLYGRELPTADDPYGESWEVVDRADDQSVVMAGPLCGKSLHDLWKGHRQEIFGAVPESERFPLLVKILDARDDLSIQVHPPADVAPTLGGEPKTEMWYIAHADPGATLYVGQKEGVTRESFAAALECGELEGVVHAIQPTAGQSIFIPSGRLHAIGAGLLIYEIQQNSDTTYRVYDWGRVGLDGQPRDLHVSESMQCIDFDDIEPTMDEAKGAVIAQCEHFTVEKYHLDASETLDAQTERACAVLAVVSGVVQVAGETLEKGDFALLPVGCDGIEAKESADVLLSRL